MTALRRSASVLSAASISSRSCLRSQFACFQEPRLFGEAVFQVPRPAGKILVFAGLLHQLLYELGDATMEAYKSGPFFHHFPDRRIKFEPLGSASVLHRLQFVVGCVEALFDGTDVSLECNKLLRLIIGER